MERDYHARFVIYHVPELEQIKREAIADWLRRLADTVETADNFTEGCFTARYMK